MPSDSGDLLIRVLEESHKRDAELAQAIRDNSETIKAATDAMVRRNAIDEARSELAGETAAKRQAWQSWTVDLIKSNAGIIAIGIIVIIWAKSCGIDVSIPGYVETGHGSEEAHHENP